MAEEAEVAEAPEQDSPVEDGGETSPEETAASGEETQAETTETDTRDETTEEAPAAGRSPALQKLLEKYDGDEDAMVSAYFEQANSTSRLYKEMEEIKNHLLAQDEEDDVDPEQLIAEDADVKGLNNTLSSLQQDLEAIQQEQMQQVGLYGQVEQEIKVLEAQVSSAEDYDKKALKSDISSKKSELRQIMSTVNRGRRELNAVNRNIAQNERQQEKARQTVLGRRDDQKRDQLRSAQVARLTREEFNSAMRKEAKDYGISPSSKQFSVLNQSVRNQLSAHLNRLPKDAPGVDISESVKKLMGEFAEAMGMKTTFQKKSAPRTPVTSGPRNQAPPLPTNVREPKLPKHIPQTDRSGKYWSVEKTKARARQLLGD